MPEQPLIDEFQTWVTLADTDAAGVIFTGAPTGWAQNGFENWMRSAGLPVEVMLERDHHYPVVSFLIEHKSSLTLGTPLLVRTGVTHVGRRSVNVVTDIINQSTGENASRVTRVIVAKSRTGRAVEAETIFRQNICHHRDPETAANATNGLTSQTTQGES